MTSLRATPASSCRTRAALLLLAAVLTLSGCADTAADGPEAGHALSGGNRSNGTVGSDHVKVGEEWWVAFPNVSNTTDRPVTLTGVKLLRVPSGVKLLGYKAVSSVESEGEVLMARQGDRDMPDIAGLKDYSRAPITLKGGGYGDIYYLAHLKVTGPIEGDFDGCRFAYEQDGVAYTQTLACDTALRVEKG